MFGRPKPSHVEVLDGDRAADCARLHATGFPHSWDSHDFERLIGAETSFGHAAVETRNPRHLLGFILSRRAADEAEVLTVVVDPANRRQRVAARLLAANMDLLVRHGVKTLFLDVSETNAAARRLYAGFDFQEVGRRQGYYRTPGGAPATSLTLRRRLG